MAEAEPFRRAEPPASEPDEARRREEALIARISALEAALSAERRLARDRDSLHQADKLSAMGSLLAGVAHELNNPLAILVAQSELLIATSGSEDQRRRAERIHAAAERAGRIVKGFLAMARQRPEQREPLQLNDLVRTATGMLGSSLTKQEIALSLDLAPDLPAVVADQDSLGQVIANLIVNAQHALADRPAPRRIGIATRREGPDLVLSVADSGPGVPTELAERIFEPYSTTRQPGFGTGIGLSVSRTAVEAHGGRLAYRPAPGGGALFTVTLPLPEA